MSPIPSRQTASMLRMEPTEPGESFNPRRSAILPPRPVACLIGGVPFLLLWDDQEIGRALAAEYHQMKTSQDQGTWSIRPEASGTGDAIELDYQKCVATVRPDSSLRPAEAVKEVACRVLLNAGRLPIHGALVTRDGGLSGTLLLGDSGHGKSSLVWLALSAKWRCVSDDLVAVCPHVPSSRTPRSLALPNRGESAGQSR